MRSTHSGRLLFALLLSSLALAQAPKGGGAAVPLADQTPPDRAQAYYHYSLARAYADLAQFGRGEYAPKAIEEYKKALAFDPESPTLNIGLAELYLQTNRIRDAVTEAQKLIQKDANNLEARKLLGRIYLRSLGDMSSGTQSREILNLAIDQYENIVRLDPKAVDSRILLGRLYLLGKDTTKAEAAFKSALEFQPESEEAVTNLVFMYNEQGQSDKAAKVLDSVVAKARSARLYIALGYTYDQQREYAKAAEAYRKAIELDSDNLDAMRGLAQSLLNAGQTDEALKQYEAIAAEDPQDSQSLLRIAEIQRRRGKFDLAIQALKRAEGASGDSLEVPYQYAQVYAAQGRYDEAITTLQALLDKTERKNGTYMQGEAGNRAIFLGLLGSLYRETGKTDKAVETFRRMLELGDEQAVRGYLQLIDTYREARQWTQASALADEAVQRFPKDRSLLITQAGLDADTGKGARASEILHSLLTPGDDRDNREIQVALAQVNSRLRNWREAEEAAAAAERLSNSPEELQYIAFLLGSIYERQKKFEQAEERFRAVLKNDPDNAATLNYLGYMLADRGVRLDEALAMIKKAVAMEPQNSAYLDSLGWAYYRLGDNVQAEDYLRKAVAKSGNDGTLHDHLAELYQKTGRLKLAATHWERALEEWGKAAASEVDPADIARVQKKLDSAKVKLAKKEKQ
ncbi:MAG: tetratricopeptide repeat protein [Acidobacteriales bacterium]|nr:tetratricopeptide repeat protein [Terriglobales bacterium]